MRTERKEPLFLAEAAASGNARVPGNAAQLLQQAGQASRPEVTFLPDEKRVTVEPNRSLLEIIEANGLHIEAGCRMGVCGADPVAIVEGMEHLSPAGTDEKETLERLGLEPTTRLACSARVRGNCSLSLTPGKGKPLEPASTQIIAIRFDPSIARVVVIGNGIAGVTAADYVRRRHPACEIHLIGQEQHHLYNRMGIERLIYGRSAMQGLYLLPESWYEEHAITTWLNTRVSVIEREQKRVRLGTGETLPYDRLILATGSASTIPPIEGVRVPGAFVLREAADALAIRAYAQQAGVRHAVIAGAGLLGLEAAYALQRLGLRTTVLERSDSLLRRQLDARGAEYLRGYLEGLGLEILTQAETVALEGDGRLERVRLRDGRTLPASIFLIAAGISPHTELARDAGLRVGRGVIVDDAMRTSDPLIFACGDVAEYRGEIQGLWPTAVAQAKVAGLNAVASSRQFTGIVPVALLKVAGIDLISIGQIAVQTPDESEIVLEEIAEHRYRKLVIGPDGRIIGAILLGYPREVASVREAIATRRDVRELLPSLRAGQWDILEIDEAPAEVAPL